MLANERRNRLLELVRRQGFASLPQLAAELGVSESTVRRDLDQLEESGAAQRIHGGVCYTGPSPKLTHFDQIQSRNWEKKRQIAQRAAELIEEGDTILLDGGSTTYELARLLTGRPLQVVTNSLPVANLFSSRPEAELIMVGGYLHSTSGVMVGEYAEAMLRNLKVRTAVISAAGVTETGLYNSNHMIASTQRAMIEAAEEVLLVADSTKFGRQSIAKVCDLTEIDHVVVDKHLETQWRDAIQAAAVGLTLAEDMPEDASTESTNHPS